MVFGGNFSGCLKSDAQSRFVLSGTDERPSGRGRPFQLYYNFFELNVFSFPFFLTHRQ